MTLEEFTVANDAARARLADAEMRLVLRYARQAEMARMQERFTGIAPEAAKGEADD